MNIYKCEPLLSVGFGEIYGDWKRSCSCECKFWKCWRGTCSIKSARYNKTNRFRWKSMNNQLFRKAAFVWYRFIYCDLSICWPACHTSASDGVPLYKSGFCRLQKSFMKFLCNLNHYGTVYSRVKCQFTKRWCWDIKYGKMLTSYNPCKSLAVYRGQKLSSRTTKAGLTKSYSGLLCNSIVIIPYDKRLCKSDLLFWNLNINFRLIDQPRFQNTRSATTQSPK